MFLLSGCFSSTVAKNRQRRAVSIEAVWPVKVYDTHYLALYGKCLLTAIPDCESLS
jgi:hypothetical protein